MQFALGFGRALALVAGLITAGAATAQDKLLIGGTPNAEPATAIVAVERGLFAQRGIEADYSLIPANPTIPPALLSNSLQVGIPTPTTLLQAVDNDLDLVVIGGVSVTGHRGTGIAVVVRKDSGVASAQDMAGKRIGVPGLNAVLHVQVRRWLRTEGVDPASVHFVESFFPVQGDMLRSDQVDAVASLDPFMSRILDTGVGEVLVNLSQRIPEGLPTMVYATTRQWAEENAETVLAFREAIEEAASFIEANPDEARRIIGEKIGMPEPVFRNMELPLVSTTVSTEVLQWWVDEMKVQGMLRTEIDLTRVILE